jgi:LytS/YehU family sensor histidine kinase
MVRPDQPLRIEVGAARAGDGGLRITVTNTRPGAAAASEGLGRGLDIVRSRLALLYGDRASLAVADAGGQFTVTVALPPPAA